MKTVGSRKIVSKEIQLDADVYTGVFGEIWFQEGAHTLHFGDDETVGGVVLHGAIGGPETVCPAGVDTVVYTASDPSIRTLKGTAQAVGYETGVTDFPDTHSAEIMAVKNIRTNQGEVSVYGVTYTSVNPLVTFDATVNGEGLLQIVAQPTSVGNSVTITSITFEFV